MKADEFQAEFPRRHRLPHVIPGWVVQGARHYITLQAKDRIAKPFSDPRVAKALLDAFLFYDEIHRWFLWTAMIMPDHLHFVATFDLSYGLRKTVNVWKRYQGRRLGVQFQSDFFEHRIRDEKAFLEKVSYIRMNPVRKGYVSNPEEWPYAWTRGQTNQIPDKAEQSIARE